MGNNLLTSAGAIALMTAVNSSDSCELEELDLTVSCLLAANVPVS